MSDSSTMHGALVVDKPADCSSFDVVRKLRKQFGIKKVGHTGTLDPFATGILVVLFGKAVKLQDVLMATEKEYLGTFSLGFETDTDDVTGAKTWECTEPFVYSGASFSTHIKTLEKRFLGTFEQVPPAVSAIKVDGKRAYRRVREGEEVQLNSRTVRVLEFELLQEEPQTLSYRLVCSKGTYVRAIARDLGRELGCGAVVSSLRRVRNGRFALDSSSTLAALEQVSVLEDSSSFIPLADLLTDATDIQFTAEAIEALQIGDQRVLDGMVPEGNTARILDESGRFYGFLRSTAENSWSLWFML